MVILLIKAINRSETLNNYMKYITLSALLLAGICTSGYVSAKKKDKKQQATEPAVTLTTTPLTTETDTLSYAFGVSLSEGGLSQYLQQLGLISDTAQIRSDYENQINSATAQAEKDHLSQELSAKLDSVTTANNFNTQQLFKGILEKLESKDTNKAYTSGLEIGGQLLSMSDRFSEQAFGASGNKLNNTALYEGVKDYISKQPLRVENSQQLMNDKMAEMTAKADAQKKEQYAETIAAGEKFMAENAQKEGVVTLEDGLQYKIIKEGTGPKPTLSDQVKVHYKGTFIDGTVFDSSIDRGEPIVFGLTGVIKGWTEILQLMPVGSKWEVYIPYDLAYGDAERGNMKPYSNLIFEIELLEIVK